MIGNGLTLKTFDELYFQKSLLGQAYYVRSFATLGVETQYNTLTCPVDKYVFFASGPTTSDESELIAYENSDFTDLGFGEALNVRRGFPNSPDIILGITNIGNIVSLGDILGGAATPAGATPNAPSGGSLVLPAPLLLEPGGKYIFVTDSLVADNLFNFGARFMTLKL